MNRSQLFGGLIFVLAGFVVAVFGATFGALVLAAIGIGLVTASWRNPKRH